jgi:xanthine dehydrogenase molybdopterin-binding subunit B
MKRGIALVPMKYEIQYAGNFSAPVSIYAADGTVAVTQGSIEFGQGINTKFSRTDYLSEQIRDFYFFVL